jgi:TRAP-type transport system periplasmic protein
MTFRTSLYALLILCALALAVGFFAKPLPASSAVQIRWILAHEPTDLFKRATEVFREEVERGSEGALTVKVLTPSDVGKPQGVLSTDDVFELLEKGEAELASTFLTGIETQVPVIGVLNLPFLFESPRTAETVLEGPVGKELLATIDTSTSARALAFTFSGGNRVIATHAREIKTADDLKGMRIVTTGGKVAEETLRRLGAIPLPVTIGQEPVDMDESQIDGIETTYTRLSPILGKGDFVRHINETNHSLFLTVLLTSKSFFDSLTPAEQELVRSASEKAARIEREDSLALAEKTRAAAQARGIHVVPLSAEVMSDLKKRTAAVYTFFESRFSTSLVERITQ